ncbi:MAG: tripartite tricarboxylate transporter TctB family protein [Paracoccus sp. (in: a-proteobacteria)]|nr:tripartite tricarboxylate transporter TctB family protein [Paracoccus sp. (in: a-proteobacteria)]
MFSRDYTDIVGGALLIVVGLGFSAYAISHYEMGTIRRLGPGAFPAALGIILAVFGALQAVPAFFREGVMPEIRIWTPIFVLLSVAAFAMMIRPFGLIPSVIAVTVISSLAEKRIYPVSLIILVTALSAISYLIFGFGLGLSIPMFRWPY